MAAEISTPLTETPRRPFGARGLVAGVFLILVSLIGLWLTPRTLWFDHIGRPDYEQLTPRNFGDWVMLPDSAGGIIDPVREASLMGVYSQVVSHTYLHRPTGRRIMLSVAYGNEQSYSKLLHRPESCYSSQGFRIGQLAPAPLSAGAMAVPGFQMQAVMGGRIEQVSYFIRMGDEVVGEFGWAMNFTRMRLALQGFIGDGLLFRTSEIALADSDSQAFQERFRADFAAALPENARRAFFGLPRQS